MPKKNNNKMTVVSLFSGCGGLDLGFSNSDFEMLGAYDSDHSAVECYNFNHLTTARMHDINDDLSIDAVPDIIIAGPPCQGFSTGGGYKEDDPRNSLLLTTCRIISRIKPKLAIIENVASLTNSKNKNYLRKALSILSDGGYFANFIVLSASDFGVPQRRKRTVLIARSRNREFNIQIPKTTKFVSVGDALCGLEPGLINHNPTFPIFGSKHEIISRNIGEDQKLCNVRASTASIPTWNIPEVFGQTSIKERTILEAIRLLRRRNRKRSFGDADPVTINELCSEVPLATQEDVDALTRKDYLRKSGIAFDLRNTFNGKYRRLSFSGISPTVDTRFGDIQLFLHPKENRSLTIREAARIQGFPDDFIFPDDSKSAFRLIGNAVPPPLAQSISKFCRELI